jgi:transposase
VDKLLEMSAKEITRLEAMQKLKARQWTQTQAASQLKLSVRQVKRLYRAFRERGAKGLVSKRRGRPSPNRLAPEIRQQALDLILKHYRDFGPSLACEKLAERHELKISDESVRQMMIAEGLWKPKKARKLAVHQMRERRACFGELVQADGSDHKWFEDRAPRCTLLALLDDATSRVGSLLFVPEETYFGYGQAVRLYIARQGKPQAFYSDKHGIFRVNLPSSSDGDALTQFGRAMRELDIQILCANTPQAKGRIERLFSTLQDRLVKELRLRGISDIVSANVFLPEYLDDHNRRFAIAPKSCLDAHRPLARNENLDRILAWQETRTLSSQLTLQYKKTVYQIHVPRPTYAMRKAPITVCESDQGLITLLYKDRPLEFSVFHRQPLQSQEVSSKSIDHALRKPNIPAPDHPWRKPLHPHKSQKGDISTLPK